MYIRQNIIISLILHTALIGAIFSVNYWERACPLPKNYMVVSLIEELSGNRFFAINQDNSDKRHHDPEFISGERSKKQYSSLSVKSVPIQEILRPVMNTGLRMTEDKGITDSEGNEIREKSKDEIALTLPRGSTPTHPSPLEGEGKGGGITKSMKRSQNLNENITSEDGKESTTTSVDPYASVSGGIVPDQGIEFFAVKSQPRDSGNFSVLEAIRFAIERAKSYPFLARKRGIEGTVLVSFKIDRKGFPKDIKILKSSGYQILDEEVPRMLRKASPFPELIGEIVIPITFKLSASTSDP